METTPRSRSSLRRAPSQRAFGRRRRPDAGGVRPTRAAPGFDATVFWSRSRELLHALAMGIPARNPRTASARRIDQRGVGSESCRPLNPRVQPPAVPGGWFAPEGLSGDESRGHLGTAGGKILAPALPHGSLTNVLVAGVFASDRPPRTAQARPPASLVSLYCAGPAPETAAAVGERFSAAVPGNCSQRARNCPMRSCERCRPTRQRSRRSRPKAVIS
jgi:hypothetical protein